jgi:hypothetical protein
VRRADEVLRWGALDIHPLVIRATLLKHAEVSDYQVRQTACGVTSHWSRTRRSTPAGLAGELRAALEAAGPHGPQSPSSVDRSATPRPAAAPLVPLAR